MSTIQELLGIKKVTPQVYSKSAEIRVADPQLIYGMELEIEGVDSPDSFTKGIGTITHTEDGSLRNNGREFITMPMNMRSLHHALKLFFDNAKLNEDNYSDRTSVHVHCNVQDLQPSQLASVLLLYQVFEGLLYGFIGNERDKNIFCVPWSETNLSFNILNNLSEANTAKILGLKQWQKYTGVNLLPIFSQGTIEFRQMHGNCNLPYIADWLNLIGSMFAYARNNSLADIKDRFIKLNTTSSYRPLTEDVFKDWSPLLLRQPNYWNMMEDGVLNMKYLLLENKQENKSKTAYSRFTLDIPNWVGQDAFAVPVAREPGRLDNQIEPLAVRIQRERAHINAVFAARPAREEGEF